MQKPTILDIDNPEEVSHPVYLTRREYIAIGWLLELAKATYFGIERSGFSYSVEDKPGGHLGSTDEPTGSNMPIENFIKMQEAMDALDLLPDDKLGAELTPAAKAEWALRRLIGIKHDEVPNETAGI